MNLKFEIIFKIAYIELKEYNIIYIKFIILFINNKIIYKICFISRSILYTDISKSKSLVININIEI